jgi:hypothetical protein
MGRTMKLTAHSVMVVMPGNDTCIDRNLSGYVTGGYDARCDFFTPCPVYVVDDATAGGYKLHPATVSN